MKRVAIPGACPALVQDIATAAVRLEDDALQFEQNDVGSPFGSSFVDPAMTLEEYWRQRNGEVAAPAPDRTVQVIANAAPFDSFTIDAEILVDRTAQTRFTTADLADLLGILPPSVRKGIWRGNIPEPRWPAKTPLDSHRWSYRQTVEIVAARLRRSARLTDGAADCMQRNCA